MGDRRDVPTKAKDDSIHSVAVLLSKLDEGSFETEISDEMHELCKRMQHHATHFGKAKGEIGITLKFDVDQAGTCNITTDLKVKVPKTIRGRTMTWLNRSNHIAFQNPRQADLPGIREVPKSADDEPQDLGMGPKAREIQ